MPLVSSVDIIQMEYVLRCDRWASEEGTRHLSLLQPMDLPQPKTLAFSRKLSPLQGTRSYQSFIPIVLS